MHSCQELIMKRSMWFVSLLAIGAVTSPVLAQSGGVVAGSAPGMVGAARTVDVTASIVTLDKATREVALKGPQGNIVVVTAGPQVTNFDKLKVGDSVKIKYVEAVAVSLKKGGGLVVGKTESAGAAGAKAGATPAGVGGREVTIVADVVAVDPAKQMVTLKGPNRTVDVRIDDPEQFKRIAKGDQVEAKYVQAVAVAVEAPPAK
jgi:Cu/Ag efflux protein CusF